MSPGDNTDPSVPRYSSQSVSNGTDSQAGRRDSAGRVSGRSQPAPGGQRGGNPARAAVLDRPAAATTTRSAAPSRSRTQGRRSTRRNRRHVVPIVAVGIAATAAAAAGVIVTHPALLTSHGPQHKISAPGSVLTYTQAPALAKKMDAAALKADIVRKGNGEAKNVVDAVYEANASSGAKSPMIVLFIGGNLSGSATAFISSFTGMLPGAFTVSPGSLGGQAACVPGTPGTAGKPAECAWADNDTFGLFASPTLSASALGAELRAMRPFVERRSTGG